MDVTPPPKMYEAMVKLTDAVCGEEPGKLEQSTAANRRRANRRLMLDVMHNMVAMAMREGAARAFNPYRTDLGAAQANAEMSRAVKNG